jgi:hypothetical protein
MLPLTPKMREVLKAADLERDVINKVPLGTMYGLDHRELIQWPKAGGSHSTASGRFPEHSGVKLTAEGVRAARTIQGLTGNV